VRAQINLASAPFRRDRLTIVASSAVAGILIVLLAGLVSMYVRDRQSMQASLTNLESLNRQLAVLGAQQRKLDAQLREPRNADVLERSQFINALLYRKGISWTKLFGDLETVLPPNVRVISVRPQVDSQDRIYLDMVVGADAQPPIINLLTKFETSDLFGSTAVYGILPPSQTDPLFRYRVSVSYAQRL
jgi:type IV pilus assembly protein PilN